MSSARHAVALLLKPELAALAAVAPAAAEAKIRILRRSPQDFARGAAGLVAAWLARHHGEDGPWTWAMGDAHLGNFAVLATGPRGADGQIAPTIDVADVDDEHPAPWTWDLLRLGASYAHAWTHLGGRRVAELAALAVEAYGETLLRLADGDALAGRIDLAGLPESVKLHVQEATREAGPKRHLADFAVTKDRRLALRRDDVTEDDPDAAMTLRAAWSAHQQLPEHTWLDCARRRTAHGVGSRGRRRWLILVAEGRHHRLLEVKELPPSCLDRVLGVSPFPPRQGPPLTIPMGDDPFQRILTFAQGRALVRTRCHARMTLDPAACNEGDRRRAAHLHGQLIARFHWRGLSRLVEHPAPLAVAAARLAPQQAARLGRHGVRLADHLNRCWAAFRD